MQRYVKCRHKPLLQWSDNWFGRFYGMNKEMILAVSNSAQWVTVRKSTIPHPDSGVELFFARSTGKIVSVGVPLRIYGLCRPDHRTAQGKAVRAKSDTSDCLNFGRWANVVPEKITDNNRITHNVWMILAPLYAIWYTNDARCFPGHTTLEIERVDKLQRNNVPFLLSGFPSSPKYFSSIKNLSVQELHDIALEEYLLVYCANKCEFYGRGILQ